MMRSHALRCSFDAMQTTATAYMRDGITVRTQVFMCLRDKNDGMSLTNDIENALHALVMGSTLMPGMRVIYADSEGIWDEVIIDEQCRFVDFRAWRAPTRDDCARMVIESIVRKKEKPDE